MAVEKELHDLRERLAQVEKWKKRREEIETELNKVWVGGQEEELGAPAYVVGEEQQKEEEQDRQTEAEETQDEYQEAQSRVMSDDEGDETETEEQRTGTEGSGIVV